jgi:hypothetical protein
MEHFATSLQHLLAELERIDLLIRVQVWRARQIHEADAQFQGLYVSEQEVDTLLSHPAGLPHWAVSPAPVSKLEVQEAMARLSNAIARGKEQSLRQGITLHLEELVRLFELDPLERDILLICLAPELDLRYERLYSYLQDDVTKKRPSVDLVLNLLSSCLETKLAGRRYFAAEAPLRRRGLLTLFEDPPNLHPPLLAKYLKVDERVVDYLHGLQEVDGRIRSFAKHSNPKVRIHDLIVAGELKERLQLIARNLAGGSAVIHCTGDYGVGKQTVAESLCGELGIGLLLVTGVQLLQADGQSFQTSIQVALREALFQGAALYWQGFDVLLGEDHRNLLEAFVRAIEIHPGVTFLAGNSTWEPADALDGIPFVRIELSRPTYHERVDHWQRALESQIPREVMEEVANKFRLSGGEIRDAAVTARNLARWRGAANGIIRSADLHTACRLQSNRKLTMLARKITPHYGWEDLVLPAERFDQLREVCNSIKHRAVVYEKWGFNRKLSLGKGLNVLFSGPSGTGKTMAAETLARELGLDLYKIDLSSVVSKYIGETEKNLARIFAEAETSNAILFFDEADALFGKRSEVRDAHDRYANIEISYLLQKMEEYEGMVILASNLRKNMDEAFVRRMHFTVEFPFPGEDDRYRIWKKIWPSETPRSSEIDLAFMAQHFEIAGGNIRNIALAASFFAADDGGAVTMAHLIRATRREYQKMGKVVRDGDFGKHAGVANTR